MKYLMTCALLLCSCVHASLDTTSSEHNEFDLSAAPSVNLDIMVPITFEAKLSTRIAAALKQAEMPSSKFVDSVELDGAVASATLGTDTTLAGIYSCKINLTSDSGSVTLVDQQLSAGERARKSTELSLQNATLGDVRPLLEQANPRLSFALQIRPSELTADKLITDLAVDVSADLSASL